ncbi:hypothetical protein OROMI_012441 [Orobanche minor]
MDVESAHKFYVNYGGKHGFNVKIRNSRKNNANFVKWVLYTCSKEGFKNDHDKRRTTASYSRPITRCGCEAHMTILLQNNGIFKVVSFQDDHNHALISTPMKHMMKVNRSLSNAQKSHADDAEYSGISIKSTVELMSREVGGPENLGFTKKDYMNYIHRKRMSKMEKGDASAILHYFQKMQSENSSYFYSIQLDEDDMITNIFWADTRSVSDYKLFGDVLCFDTTYRTNEYGRPFAPFVGVNHHKQTILFGAALLYDETIESFTWLFETFLAAMSGKQPLTILTDQSAAMARAIKDVLPQTTHRLCVWHLYQNAAKNLSNVFHGSSEFENDFGDCMYEHEFEYEWLLAWNAMLEKYRLKENKWLNALFELREKWALVYGRDTFTADMKSTQRSEGMNNVLKKYLKPEHNLLRFFEHYERVLSDRRYEELCADFKMIDTTPVLAISAHMLEHGAEYLYCSCKKYTSVGILCAHALKVLDKKNVKKITPQYILKRWTREARAVSINSYHDNEVRGNPKESVGKRYGYLCRTSRDILTVAADDEELTKYAHECLVEMLKGLELIKKNRNKKGEGGLVEKPIVAESLEIEGIVHSNADQTSIVRGVKRKATIGRPRARFKDPMEQKKRKEPKKSTKTPTRRKIPMQEFESMGNILETQQSSGSNVQPSDVLNQDQYLGDLDRTSTWQGDISLSEEKEDITQLGG